MKAPLLRILIRVIDVGEIQALQVLWRGLEVRMQLSVDLGRVLAVFKVDFETPHG